MKNNLAFLRTLNEFMSLLKVVMIAVFVLYALSGITFVKPGEIAMILRLGALVGHNRAEQLNPAGWLFALPYPIDVVVKVPEKEIKEVEVNELAGKKTSDEELIDVIDPIVEGYCISGDLNIFQVTASVKFQISDPAKAMFGYSGGFKSLIPLLRTSVVHELTQVAAGFPIDGVLTGSKEEIALQVKEKVQRRLERLETGLTLLSIELSEITPPAQLKGMFEDVNTAYIKRKNFINKSLSDRENKLPKAKAFCQKKLNDAYSYHEKVVSTAQAEAGKFLEMLAAYKESPAQIRKDFIDKTRKKIFSNVANLTLLPGISLCPADVRTFIENSRTAPIPYSGAEDYD